MRTKYYLPLFYFLMVSAILSALSCSSKERKADENLLRLDKTALNYTKPITEKELPIFDPKLAFFEFNRASLTSDAKKALIPTAQFLRENPRVRLVVEGYCDERGSDEYNMKLGQRRAESVKDFLVRHAVPDTRVSTVSYGRIIGTGDKTWAENRRVGFQIVYPRGE